MGSQARRSAAQPQAWRPGRACCCLLRRSPRCMWRLTSPACPHTRWAALLPSLGTFPDLPLPLVGRAAGAELEELRQPSVRLLGGPVLPSQPRPGASRQLSGPGARLWVRPGGHLHRPAPTPSLGLHSKQRGTHSPPASCPWAPLPDGGHAQEARERLVAAVRYRPLLLTC